MSEHPTAYQCLPMVVANQWGWQVLCPTDVRVTWDGSPEPRRAPRRGRPAVGRRDQEPVRPGDRHVLAPLAVPHPARLGPLRQGAEQPLEAELRAAGGGGRDVVAQLHLHAELEGGRAGRGRVRRGERAWASSSRSRTRRSGAPRRASRRSTPSSPRRRPSCCAGAPSAGGSPREPVSTHRLYLKAEDVEEHLTKVPVPPVVRTWGDGGTTGGGGSRRRSGRWSRRPAAGPRSRRGVVTGCRPPGCSTSGRG